MENKCKNCKFYNKFKEPIWIKDHVYTGSCRYWNGHSTEPEGFCYKFEVK